MAAAKSTGAIAPDQTRVSGRRFVAHFVDGVLFAILFFIAIIAVELLPRGTLADIVFAATAILGLTVGHIAYFVLLQRRSGHTPGKHLVGIRVVDAAGATPGTGSLIKRSIPLLIEYLYVTALIGMFTSAYRQRFGDRWGDTYVVRDR